METWPGYPDQELQQVDLCELVREVVRLQEKPLRKAGITLKTTLSERCPYTFIGW